MKPAMKTTKRQFREVLKDLVDNKNGCSPLGKKISLTKLARELEITRQSVTAYLDGASYPTADKLVKIADFFHVSTDYLLGRTEWQTPQGLAVGSGLGLGDRAMETLQAANQAQETNLLRFTNFLLANPRYRELTEAAWYYFCLCNPSVLEDITEYLDAAPEKTAARLRDTVKRLAKEDALAAYGRVLDEIAATRYEDF